jgi:hypothetical protein
MIVALLNRHRSGGKATPGPHFTTSSSRQGKLIALIDGGPQRVELNWSRHHARRHRHCLLSVIGLVRHTPDRAVAGLAGHSDHIIIAGPLPAADLPCSGLLSAASLSPPGCVTVADRLCHLSAREVPDTNGERS